MKKNKKRSKKGTGNIPRLSVFRSNRFIYAQIINDEKGQTVTGISEKQVAESAKKEKKSARARRLGISLAKQALEKKIKKVVFDKGSYRFHGRVKEVAEGAREGGLQF